MTFLVVPSASTQYQDCASLRKLVVALLFGVLTCGPALHAADGIAQPSELAKRPDRILADFEGKDYGNWSVTGTAFGDRPTQGEIPRHRPVAGRVGQGMTHTYRTGEASPKGHAAVGALTSPEFTIDRHGLSFLFGGGSQHLYVEVIIDGERRFRTTRGHYGALSWRHCDLTQFQGRKALIRAVDRNRGSQGDNRALGYLYADHFVLSDTRPERPHVLPCLPTRQQVRQEISAITKPLASRDIIFATRENAGSDGHWYANFSHHAANPDRHLYGPGGRLCRLNMESGKLTVLLEDLDGGVRDPQVHYDAEKILFSYRKGNTPYYHLYEINIDGTGLRQITDGSHDDIEPSYLPDDSIVFCSSRCNRMVNCWVTRVAVVYRCEADGSGVRPLSCNIEQDNTPWPLPDGRILYQRWEYIDRSQIKFHHLWTMNPDGTHQMVYYGNMRPGTVMIDAKPIPGTNRIVASFSPNHGRREHEGYVTIVDPSAGPDSLESVRQIGSETYRDPYPLSEKLFLVARHYDFGFLDDAGRYTPIWAVPDDWDASVDLWVHEPRPLEPRPRERRLPDRTDPTQTTGTVLLDNVYIGRNMAGVKQGDIKKLLVLEALPKPVNFSGGWAPMSFAGTFTLERVVGTVPVEEDGSAHFELPAMRSFFFVALDENDLSVKRMQSFMAVQPGERLSCIGCHENRDGAPYSPRTTIAMRREPSEVESLEGIAEIFDFPRDIQPILDRHCVDCHDYTKGNKGGPRDGGVILSGDRGGIYSHSYYTLSTRYEFMDGENARFANRPPRSIGTAASPIMQRLDGQHYGVKLPRHDKDMIRYWIESGAPYPGTYAALGTGMISGNSTLEPIVARRCASCHTSRRLRLPRSPGEQIVPEVRHDGVKVRDHENYGRSAQLVYNLTRPEYSLMLLAPLSTKAGGYGICRPLEGDTSNQQDAARLAGSVFRSKDDADYQAMLAAIRISQKQLMHIKRFDMPGFRPNQHYIREMQKYGILPTDLPEDGLLNPYEIDKRYWRSHHYIPSEQ